MPSAPDGTGRSGSGAFAGQVALVTGATSGIGRAIARALAAEGATVHAVGRDLAALSSLAADVAGVAGVVVPAQADLTEDAEVAQLVRDVLRHSGRVDVLVHAAGNHVLGAVADIPVEKLDDLHRVNLRAPYLLTRAVLPALRELKGQVVFVNSSAGRRASGSVGAYAATKHGLRALTDSLRDEVNPQGVRVLSVYPGRTATRMQEDLHRQEGRDYRPERLLQPEDVASVVLNALALPRTAEVTDIAIRPFLQS